MKRWKIFLILAIAILAVVFGSYKAYFQRASYDPQIIAASETAMWKAYYSGDKTELAMELFRLERSQFELTALESAYTARLYAQAAMNFLRTRSNYEAQTLPFLERAYDKIRRVKKMSFDPKAAAKAELGWWIIRRDPNLNTTENVGKGIAELYAVLYGGMKDQFLTAGLLRAQAAALRDEGEQNADWERIQALLEKSYTALIEGVQ
ncbi:MAG: hypothetical protein AB1656_15660 [Candidatus Omnitrophota bacterium]